MHSTSTQMLWFSTTLGTMTTHPTPTPLTDMNQMHMQLYITHTKHTHITETHVYVYQHTMMIFYNLVFFILPSWSDHMSSLWHILSSSQKLGNSSWRKAQTCLSGKGWSRCSNRTESSPSQPRTITRQTGSFVVA